ncbi:pullulanase-type alpha-1,6-glucosidase [Pengzhenrongella frigida]|uniref:Pullulanase-type alpha-1,6-glucosidase n=1 Tax=Pengzhenrongella frigida TaxID=1259133 RepID=A0A4Q5N4G9_9MICO|nr:pullulanase-type alpha-1,6-glucosidase [Cellulomonas sp. HLT2-17]RYV52243.1 pullulanase-type alpha-1,6-glucosidase [Cellulomonas sp. HLT2-17]
MTTVTARLRPLVALAAATAVALTGATFAPPGITAGAAAADRTFALVGSLQSEIGCTADWQPECAASELVATGVAGVYAAQFSVPAGTYEYKVAVNDTWDEAYGVDGGGDNAPIVLAGTTTLRFAFDDTTHRITLTPVDLPAGYTAADDALVAPPVRQPGSDEQFYFVMTDRFANGDPTNDTGGLTGDALSTGFDPANKGFYNGGDLAGLTDNLDYIEGLGTTAIWLTPSFKNRAVQGTGANASAGYHGYWITDFTQIDPHLGTNAELEALIADAHARGIKVYFDIITNHTADVIDYTQGQYGYVDQATTPYQDAAGTAFDPATYAGTDTFPALDAATSFPYTPTIAAADADLKVPAWLNDPTLYHNRGNSTWAGESVTYGDFDGLDDLMTEHPTVVNGFVDVYDQWIDLGIDGFRIDTVKHVNLEFWQKWTTQVLDYAHNTAGKPDFFMFGEVYDADAAKLSPYVRKTDMSSVLDFAFQAGATGFAQGFSGAGLSTLFASDDMYTTPDSSATALPTFLGNHDMGRIGFMVKGASDPLARSELAHSLMYLTRGQPVVYYGDEQGFVGNGDLGGKDKDARQSLFASQVPEYSQQTLLTGEVAGAVDRFDPTAPLYAHIAELAALRETTPALSQGAQIERFSDESVYAFSRVDATEKVEHLVALNNSAAARTVTLTTLTPGATFSVLYGDTTATTADAAGQVTVSVPALGAVVLVAGSTVAAPATTTPLTLASPSAGAAIGGLAPVTADVDDDVWQQTSFSYRVAGETGWTALGTAETTDPRVFHDVSDLAKGTLVEYRAVSVDAAGARTAASTFASVGVAIDGAVPPPPPVDEGPKTVTVAGDHNSEMGCASDWMPLCTQAQLTKRADGMFGGTFTLPAGTYQYKIAINGSWDVNYGTGGVAGGDNATYTHAGGEITFLYDPITHYFTSSAQGPILTLPGSHQSEVGCAADWQIDCLAAWLQDLDGDGTFTYTTDTIPTGTYETKVAHNLSWAENYGADGVLGGGNIAFSASTGKPTTFSYVLATHRLTIEATDPPLPGIGQAQAHWIDSDTVAWPAQWVPAALDPTTLTWTLHSTPDASLAVADGVVVGGSATELTFDPAGLTADQLDRFPALAGYVALTLPAGTDRAAVKALLTGELLVGQYGADGAAQAITGVQIPGVLDDLFAADAADRTLGATWRSGVPSLALWAPTAQKVDLLLWTGDVAAEPQRVPMTAAADGSWTVKGARSWARASYRYEVTVYAPTTDTVEVNQVTDPYSVALTTNSMHSMLVDLADRAYRPRTWERTEQPVVTPVDQTIYELHVRDFSINDATVPAALRGTYGAFATNGSGRLHLRELERAGLTTVHLLPTFDIATIEEDRALQAVPDGDLASFAADSPAQQAAVGAVAGTDGFNWGYDPLHFSAPEGSYAVNPAGGARVAEFRTMVGALHSDGLQVVLDQVFNHTAASGQDPKSILDRVVPGYYQRLNAAGAVETSTCCQNVATEHQMAEKLMVDSVVLWARDYKVDGFRFDLMGHHSTDTMLAVRAALDELTPRHDGVNGKAVYLYGEGWNFGEVADNRLFTQATQGQLGGTGIGTFSDRLRDGVRGGGPFDEDPRIQGFGSGGFTDANGVAANGTPDEQLARVQHDGDLVRLGLAGNLRDFELLASDGTVRTGEEIDYNGQPAGYADSPEEVISYVDAHDNETLFDSLMYKLPVGTSMADRVRMNTVSLATTALSQTPSFWHAGSDLLRSKSLDRNSYDSGDWFNSLDFTGQDNGFGRGLPPSADNSAKWPIQAPLLANPALKPAPTDIRTAATAAEELLTLRFSTPLFRLGSAALIEQKVSFPGSGPDAAPGVIVMRVDDSQGKDVDRELAGMLVVFNASDEPVTQRIGALAGHSLTLSPVQARGADAVVQATRWTRATGEVTVPARTVAVLQEAQPKKHHHWWDWR